MQAKFATLLLDPCGRIVFCSPDAPLLLDAQDKPLIGQSVTAVVPALPALTAPQPWQELQRNGAPLEYRLSTQKLAGQTYVTLELRACATAQHALALPKLIHALEASNEIAAITTTDGRIEYVNRAFTKCTGFPRAEALGRTHDLLGASQSPELYAQMWATLRAGKPFRGVFVNCHKNGHTFHEERQVRPFIDHQGRATHYIFSGRDVSDRERIIQRIEHLANHDSLTSLPNRNLFMDRLRQASTHAARRNGGFTLLLLDLDHFKSVNDRFGHAAGDALLIAVANRLRGCVREEDTVARLGGDEFAVILFDTALPDDALVALEKIVDALHQPFVLDGYQLPTNASIGVALYPDDSVGKETLLKFADIAMYRAKSAGGNGYHFHRQRGLSPRFGRTGKTPAQPKLAL